MKETTEHGKNNHNIIKTYVYKYLYRTRSGSSRVTVKLFIVINLVSFPFCIFFH